MLADDRELTKDDVQAVTSRDALGKLFAHLGYNTDLRQQQTADALGISQSGLKSALKHVERVSADGELQVFLFEVASVTLAHRRAITSLLNNRQGEFLFVLTTPDYERLDFVLVERFQKEPEGKAHAAPVRPLAITVERLKPTPEVLRTLRRMTYTCADDLAQLEKLLSAFRIAQWSEPRFNNVALFSDHYLTHRLPEEPEWQDNDGVKAAFKAIRNIGDRNKGANAKAVDEVILPVLEQLGHTPKAAKATDGGPMLRLSDTAVCFAYHWTRALDTKDDNDPERPEDVPAMRVVSEFEAGKTQWAILTNGKQWRLYCARAHGRHANFYEVDFRETLADQEADGEAFRYFWLMLRAHAFTPGAPVDDKPGPSFLDRIFDGSREYAKELGEKLKSRVFEDIFPHLAEGFITHIRAIEPVAEFDEERLHEVFRATLTLLYRLIFLLYAESLDLLPVTEANYREVSLRKLTKEIGDRAGTNQVQAEAKLKQSYSPSETALYDRLTKLFRVVDQGDNTVNVPTYNGGLFITEPDDDDETDEAKAARFLAKYKLPDRFLAMGLDSLARGEDGKSHKLVSVDYKSLGVRQLGSIYEGLLEFKVQVAAERMAVVKAKKGEAIVPARQAEKEKLKVVTRSKMRGAEGGYLRKGTVYLTNDKQERKASGSYYTPDYIVKYIVEQTVGPVLQERFDELRDEFRKAEVAYRAAQEKDAKLKAQGLGDDPEKVANDYKPLVERLFTLRVLDPAMGSGHFLVEAVDFITDRMLAFLNGFGWNPVQAFIQRTRADISTALNKAGVDIDKQKLTDINLLKRHVLKRCIFGVDLNPMAVELAKVSLWLDCFTLGAPLSFLDHHLKCGNSLIGVTVEEVEKTLKKSAGMFSSRFAGLMLAAERMREIARLADATSEQAAMSRREFRRAADELAPFKRILDIYTSQWFGNGLVAEKTGTKKKKDGKIAAIEWLNSDAVSELLAAGADGFIDDKGKALGDKPQKSMLDNTRQRSLSQSSRRKPSITDRYDNKADAWFNNVPKVASRARDEHRFFHWELEFPEVFYAPTTPGGQSMKRIDGTGFDVVVGNPPYALVQAAKAAGLDRSYFSRFAVANYKVDVYPLFIERSIQIARQLGLTSLIVPNPWLTQKFSKPLRRHLLNGSQLLELIVFHYPVFEEATVASVVFVALKSPEGGGESRIAHLTSPPAQDRQLKPQFNAMQQGLWRNDPDSKIETRHVGNAGEVIQRLKAQLVRLDSLARVSLGCQAYNSTKHTKAMIRDRVFHADRKVSEEYMPELGGGDLSPFAVTPKSSSWIKYGPWLHDYREMDWLTGPRVLVREVLASPPYRLVASYTDDTFCNYKTVLNVVPREGHDVSMKVVAGLLNSSVVSAVLPLVSNKLVAAAFPRLSVGDLAGLWFPSESTLARHADDVACIERLTDEAAYAVKHPPIDGRHLGSIRQELDAIALRLFGIEVGELRELEEVLRLIGA